MALAVDTLEESFARIRPDAPAFVADFYTTLLADHPEVHRLFARTDMAAQRDKLLSALVLVVEHLRRPETLAPTLRDLGARHTAYGVQPEHYPMIGAALLRTFASHLGPAWTPDVEQAWIAAYGAIADVMIEGAASVPAGRNAANAPSAPE